MKFLIQCDENFVKIQQYWTNGCEDEKIRV